MQPVLLCPIPWLYIWTYLQANIPTEDSPATSDQGEDQQPIRSIKSIVMNRSFLIQAAACLCAFVSLGQNPAITNNLNAFIKTNPAMLEGLDSFPWEGCQDFVLEITHPDGSMVITQRVCGVQGFCIPVNPLLKPNPENGSRTIELRRSTLVQSGDFNIALAEGTYKIDRDGMIRELKFSIEPR